MPAPRLTVTVSRASLEHLVAETLLVRRTAAALEVKCDDARVNATQRKYGAMALAARLVGVQVAWPVSIEAMAAALQQYGISADRARELAGVLAASGRQIVTEREMIGDAQAIDVLQGLMNGGPYVQVSARLADASAPTPAPEPTVDARPPAHENPVTEDDYPVLPTPADADLSEVV